MKAEEKGLSTGSLVMLALGTVIGGSFFLGSAIAINAAGPGVILAFLLGGLLVYVILFALSEMTVAYPAAGSFRTFSEHVYGPMAGFVVGWVYWTGLVLAMSSEAIAVSVFIRSYVPYLSLPLLGTAVIVLVTLVNLLGVDKLSKLESSLAAVKVLAIIGFILLAVWIVTGWAGRAPLGFGQLFGEPFFANGIKGIAGSMLIVMFTYAGFEIVGLAASETHNARENVPKAIALTVLSLAGLYIVAVSLLVLLVPTSVLSEKTSPLVTALSRNGLGFVSNLINIVLITAILSTMLAAVFGIARMLRSLADEGHAPSWLKDKGDIPYRGIIFSGGAMLLGLAMGFILPQKIYLFLVSSGGFAFLFVYFAIVATHFKFRKVYGCPPEGRCQLPGYPYTSLAAVVLLIGIMASMPFIKGQGSGLVAGLTLVLLYAIIYLVKKYVESKKDIAGILIQELNYFKLGTVMEAGREISFSSKCPSCDDKGTDANKEK